MHVLIRLYITYTCTKAYPYIYLHFSGCFVSLLSRFERPAQTTTLNLLYVLCILLLCILLLLLLLLLYLLLSLLHLLCFVVVITGVVSYRIFTLTSCTSSSRLKSASSVYNSHITMSNGIVYINYYIYYTILYYSILYYTCIPTHTYIY